MKCVDYIDVYLATLLQIILLFLIVTLDLRYYIPFIATDTSYATFIVYRYIAPKIKDTRIDFFSINHNFCKCPIIRNNLIICLK